VYTVSVARPTVRDRSTTSPAPDRRWLWRHWRFMAFARNTIAAFVVKMLRRPRKWRTFGPAVAEVAA